MIFIKVTKSSILIDYYFIFIQFKFLVDQKSHFYSRAVTLGEYGSLSFQNCSFKYTELMPANGEPCPQHQYRIIWDLFDPK